MTPARISFFVVVVVGVAAFAISFIKSMLGKASRGVLHVPQGKDCLDVRVRDDVDLRFFRYGQTFEVLFVPSEAEGSIATLLYKNKPVGVICSTTTRSLALLQLAKMHSKVMVQTVVAGIDSSGRPLMHVMLPNDAWFKRAISPLV